MRKLENPGCAPLLSIVSGCQNAHPLMTHELQPEIWLHGTSTSEHNDRSCYPGCGLSSSYRLFDKKFLPLSGRCNSAHLWRSLTYTFIAGHDRGHVRSGFGDTGKVNGEEQPFGIQHRTWKYFPGTKPVIRMRASKQSSSIETQRRSRDAVVKSALLGFRAKFYLVRVSGTRPDGTTNIEA